MFQKEYFIPDKDYLISCMSSIYDLIEIYGDEAIKLLEDNTSRRIENLSEETNDQEVISLYESLQNYKNSAIYNIELNKEDLF